jgi:hypothetical protein
MPTVRQLEQSVPDHLAEESLDGGRALRGGAMQTIAPRRRAIQQIGATRTNLGAPRPLHLGPGRSSRARVRRSCSFNCASASAWRVRATSSETIGPVCFARAFAARQLWTRTSEKSVGTPPAPRRRDRTSIQLPLRDRDRMHAKPLRQLPARQESGPVPSARLATAVSSLARRLHPRHAARSLQPLSAALAVIAL